MLRIGSWNVGIQVKDDRIVAVVTNLNTGSTRFYERVYANYTDGERYHGYDEAIGECLTAIRDTFDKV